MYSFLCMSGNGQKEVTWWQTNKFQVIIGTLVNLENMLVKKSSSKSSEMTWINKVSSKVDIELFFKLLNF